MTVRFVPTAIRVNDLSRHDQTLDVHSSASSWAANRTGTRCGRPTTILTEFGVPHECQIVSAHRTPAWMAEYASAAASRGLRGDHRRRRRRGAPAGHGRGAHGAAGHRRAGAERGAQRARFAAVDRADAERRAGRDGGDRSRRARPTRVCSRSPFSRRRGPICARSCRRIATTSRDERRRERCKRAIDVHAFAS